MAGECGCEVREDAMSMSKSDWMRMHALMGGFAALVVPLAAAASETWATAAVVIGGTSLAYSIWDGAQLLNVVYEEEVGWTKCTIARAVMDLSLAIFGTKNLISGLSRWAASGMSLTIGGAPAPQTTKNEVMLALGERKGPPPYRIPVELFKQGRRAYWFTDWKLVGLSDTDARGSMSNFQRAFPQAMNRGARINFDITGLDIEQAWVNGQSNTPKFTNYEFFQIMTHPEWLGKTIFYQWDGGIVKWFTVTQSGQFTPVVGP